MLDGFKIGFRIPLQDVRVATSASNLKLVRGMEEHTLWTGWGHNLGLGVLATLEWKGRRGMLWAELLELASQNLRDAPCDVLVVHLGGNDLTLRTGKSLILWVIQDLQIIMDNKGRLVWSDIIPRLVWKADCNPRCTDCARCCVNREVSQAMRAKHGSVIRPPDIRGHQQELYRSDGVHLSDMGMGLFLRDLYGGLTAKIFSLVGGLRAYR